MKLENIEIIEEINISIEEEVIYNMANVLTANGLEISLFGDRRNGRQMKICSKSETISSLFQLGKLVATLENVPLQVCEAKNKERQQKIEVKPIKSPEQQEKDNENFFFDFPYRIEFKNIEHKLDIIKEYAKGIVAIYRSSEHIDVELKLNVKEFKSEMEAGNIAYLKEQ